MSQRQLVLLSAKVSVDPILIGNKPSHNSKIRARIAAGIGYTYSEDLDAFIPPKPYDSWVLTASANWVSPLGEEPSRTVDQLTNNQSYVWDEATYQADNTTGWVIQAAS